MSNNRNLISETFDWYLKHIMPIVEQNATQQKYGYHGLYTHTSAVVFRGIDYALSMGQKPKPVVLACAFHDMARIDDAPDVQHGERALPIVERILRYNLPIPTQFAQAIMEAVKNHTIGSVAPDYISACLWDADRTRLSWEMGFESRFFTTNRAKQIASGNADEYIEFMKRNLSEYARNIIAGLDKQY